MKITDYQQQKAAELRKLIKSIQTGKDSFPKDSIIQTYDEFIIPNKTIVGIPLIDLEVFLNTAIAEAYQKGIDALAERIMCPDCEGSGVYDSPSAYDPCGSCDGTGYYFDGSLLDAYKEIDTTNTRITAMSPEGLSDKRSKEGELEVEEKDL